MLNDIKSIAVVGGGTAGLVSALILKTRFPSINIDIICSKKLGIIGVGEGSTEHWKEFMDHIGMDQYEMIRECGATYKAGTMFKDWGTPDFMHSIQTGYDQKTFEYSLLYGRQIAHSLGSKDMQTTRYWDNKLNTWFIARPNAFPTNQFHFNTFNLNNFLIKFANKKEINIIDDEIIDVELDHEGNISTIVGNNKKYSYDFYIDSSGFRKVLISRLGAKWISYKDNLRTNATMVFQTPDTEEYNIWTLSKAMKSGWLFRTPTWGRWGNGYIFDDRHISVDDAKLEAEQFIGHEIEIGKVIKFDPGRLDRVWIKNCVAIGLSANFVEPIEASSIGTTIQQSFMLMHKLINYNPAVIDRYNKSVSSMLENIRDFVCAHFLTKRKDTPFWIDVANTVIPDSLQEKLNLWKNHLPIEEDFSGRSNFQLFKDQHFLMVLQGLEWFDVKSIKNEYNMLGERLHRIADREIYEHHVNLFNTSVGIPHKKMLQLVRDGVR